MKQLLLRSLLALSALLIPSPAPLEAAAPPARDPSSRGAPKPMKAFWLSPDWLLDGVATGERPATSAQARQAVKLVLDRLKGIGVNAVLMESWLRGYSLSKVGGYPVYRLTRLADGGDLMSIVLDEAAGRGIAVHAWVHCLFWRTDNPQLTRPHHEGATVWDDLVVTWLREGAAKVAGTDRDAALACAQALAEGKPELLGEILRQSRISTAEGVLQAFVARFRAAGVGAPAWLVQTAEGDVHPSGAKDHWMTLYLNPQHPVVVERVTAMVKAISEAYPRLAGINLDHIRYPRGMLNLPPDLSAGLRPGRPSVAPERTPMIQEFPGGTGSALYKRWKQVRSVREAAVTRIVHGIRAAIRPEHVLSAAVHPLYYIERDEWTIKLSADDFVCQDWHSWGLDYAMPMVYDSDAARVGRVLKKLRYGLAEREAGRGTTTMVPGVNVSRLMKELPTWAYFDFDGLRQIKAGASPQTAREEADEPSDTMD